jgi:hypothetical protein
MVFENYITSQTTGDKNSSSQVLIQNTLGYANITSLGNFFSYDYPTYSIEGATFNYYDRDYNSISYDISNGKTYTLFFSGDSINSVSGHTGSTLLIHELYRIPFTAFTSYVANPDGPSNITTNISTPFLEIPEQVSAITIANSAYIYNFPTQYKDFNNFTQDIFFDKDQYFIDTVFAFEEPNDLTLGDCYYIDNTNNNIPTRLFLEPSATTTYRSGIGPYIITGNSIFSGSVVNGAFFTYFVPPKKPNLNVSGGYSLISVQGSTNNLSPIFNFSNVDDGDYYQLQVNYNTIDTPFAGTDIYTYIINKQIGDAEFVRTYSTPLRANDSFIYRIGNTKEIVNIFGIKQNITTYSDTIEATISALGNLQLSGHTWKNYVDYDYSGQYQISGMTIVSPNTVGAITYNFATTTNGGMAVNTISASTSANTSTIYDVTVHYNGTLYTQDWRNALYSSATWSSTGMYIVGQSPNTGLTDSSFSFTTVSRGIEGATINLIQVYNNTSLGLGIDVPSSNERTTVQNQTYNDMTTGINYTRTSSTEGSFDFGSIEGGYYRLIATAPSPQYSAFISIDTYITINSNTNLDLIFYIDWGNINATFANLLNETFL